MISILLPIYNGIEFIEESVSSIINQNFTEWELLIGVNGHHPNSEIYKIAKNYETKCEYGKIRVFDFFHLNGKSNTLNTLINYCKYDWVALMDVDDIWENNKLQCQINFINEYDVIGTRAIYFGDFLNGIIPDIPFGDITNHNFHEGNPIINSSCLIKKYLSYWDTDGLEDYELWLKLYCSDKKFYNCEEIAVKHRLHHNSSFNTKNFDEKINEIRIKYKKEEIKEEINEEIKQEN
jgi:teichuronic acid biosynthesis glycosyltransferase TuaG